MPLPTSHVQVRKLRSDRDSDLPEATQWGLRVVIFQNFTSLILSGLAELTEIPWQWGELEPL